MRFRFGFLLVGILAAHSSQSQLTPAGSQIVLVPMETQVSEHRLLAHDGRPLAIWRTTDQTHFALLDADGAPLHEQAIDFRVNAVAFNGSQLAATDDECGINVYDVESGSSAQFTVIEENCTEFSHSLAWVDETTLAIALNEWIHVPPRGTQTVGVAGILNVETREFLEVDLFQGSEQPTSFGVGGVSALDGRVMWTYSGSSRVFDALSLEALTDPIPFLESSEYEGEIGALLLPDGILQIGSICANQRCGRPVFQIRALDGSLFPGFETPRQVVSELIFSSNPSLRVPMVDVRRLGDRIFSRWKLKPKFGSSSLDDFRFSIVTTENGDPAGDTDPLAAVLDRDFLSEHGVLADDIEVTSLGPNRVLATWRNRNDRGVPVLGLNARVFESFAGSDDLPDDPLRLDVVGACGETIAWVVPDVRGSSETLSRFEVRVGSPDSTNAAPATQSEQVAGLAETGTTYFLVESATGQVVDSETMSFRNCIHHLAGEPLTPPNERGLFSSRITWRTRPGIAEIIEVRVGDPEGPVFARSRDFPKSQDTGEWVRDGMVFLMVDAQEPRQGNVYGIWVARPSE